MEPWPKVDGRFTLHQKVSFGFLNTTISFKMLPTSYNKMFTACSAAKLICAKLLSKVTRSYVHQAYYILVYFLLGLRCNT